MFHRASRGKIPYNALQIYLIFYALLFLSVAASRMVVGGTCIPNNRQRLASIFRPAARRHDQSPLRSGWRGEDRERVGGKVVGDRERDPRDAADLITFDRQRTDSHPPRASNVPEVRARARLRSEKRELCESGARGAPSLDELSPSLSETRWDSL